MIEGFSKDLHSGRPVPDLLEEAAPELCEDPKFQDTLLALKQQLNDY